MHVSANGFPGSPTRAACSLAIAIAALGCSGASGMVATTGDPAPSPSAPPAGAHHATAATASSGGEKPPEAGAIDAELNVIAIFIDSLRADRMAYSGYERPVAPRLAAFAETAVRYDTFYSISSYTAMSFGGFVGARYPSELPRSGYFFSSLPDEVVTFPEVLQGAGVSTISAHGHWYFSEDKAGFHQGFDEWELIDGLKKSNTTDQNVTSPALLALAKAQLSDPERTKGPFFAWYHFLDPHDEYVAHEGEPSFGKSQRDRYDGEIAFTDRHVGELLTFIESQPWAERTAILISADHGEAFGEHKMHRHGFELWQELVRVPMLIRVPGASPKVIDVPRSGIDLPRTILDLMDVEPDPGFRGTSLVPEIFGDEAPAARPVILDLPRTSDNDRRRAVIEGRYKIVGYGDDDGFKVFDLEADPGEERDLRFKDDELFQKLKRRYDELSDSIDEVCPANKRLKGKKATRPC